MPLIVTGSVGLDTIETPDGSRVDHVLGGSSIYFAAGASFFSPVRLVAAVGEDFPTSFEDRFHHFNVCLAGLERRQGSKTFRWHGKYHENMNERDTLEVQLNVLGEAPPPVPASYGDSEYVFLANTHPANQLALINEFPQAKLKVADTMDLWIETERDTLKQVLAKIDGFVLNDSEAILLTGERNIVRAADAILEMGPKFIIIKKGEHGAILRTKEGTVVHPAYPHPDVVDPTGAGDSFASGFMGYLAAHQDLSLEGMRRALAAGTVVASFTIEKFSIQRLEEINREDIQMRLQVFKTITDTGH